MALGVYSFSIVFCNSFYFLVGVSENMVYIIILNWKNANDTLECIKSLFAMEYQHYKVVICDNCSPDNSYVTIKNGILGSDYKFYNDVSLVELTKETSLSYMASEKNNEIYIIQTGDNLGFSGGNNVGIKFSIRQKDCDYVWVLNNDTLVEKNALSMAIPFVERNQNIGICGSKIVYMNDPNIVQSIGGVYNKFLMTTKNIGNGLNVNDLIDKATYAEIDYVIGASMIFPSKVIRDVGLLCEDYFLYYEEIDICNRIKNAGYEIAVCPEFVIKHRVGASTEEGRSDIADFCSVRNRLLIANKFHPHSLVLVWLSLIFVFLNRLKRKELNKAKNVFMILFGKRKMNKV